MILGPDSPSVDEPCRGTSIPISAAIGLHFYPLWEAASIDEWLYNGGLYELIGLHFLLGVACYMGHEWEHSFRLDGKKYILICGISILMVDS